MPWLEVSLQTTDEAVDWVRTLANPSNDRSIAILEQRIEQPIESALDDSQEWGQQICVYLPEPAGTSLQNLMDRLSGLYRTQQISEPVLQVVEQIPLLDAAPQQIGRFVILTDRTSWEPTSTDLPIRLSSQFAFGSGLHPTTQLMLRMIERYVTPGLQTLDLGCGSGILTIAMAQLGAVVLALDNDRAAVSATQTAIQQNQVSATVQEGSLGQGSDLGHWMGGAISETILSISPQAEFDLIVANLFGRIHLKLASDYRAALRSTSGCLITSGYTTEYEIDINQAMAEAGMKRIDRDTIEDWIVQVHQ